MRNPEDNTTPQITEAFNVKTIKKGIVLFVSITLISLVGIFLYNNTGKTIEVWSQIKWYYILIGFVFIFNDLFFGALRNHIFAVQFVPKISLMVSVKANLANIFMGAVTPSQSGGGPAQVYIFYRHGLKLADTISISFFNWISTLVFFPISGAIAIYILKDNAPSGFVMSLTKFGFSAFATLLTVIVVGLFSPQVLGQLIKLLGSGIGVVSGKLGSKILNFSAKAVETMTDYQQRYLGLIKTKPQLMIYSFLITIILYFNKYVLAYIIVLAFGQEADFWTVIAIQGVLQLLLYFSPSPGGSGIAEITTATLMASVLSSGYIPSFTLLIRTFLFFVPALLGAFVVLKQISKE